jgi:Uma2 family endonuclease
MSSPSYRHQHILMEISGVFYNWFRGKKCESLVSPFDITFVKEKNNTCVVQPDIMVICDKENLNKDNKYMGIPSLVVEVLSPSTRNKDLLKKLDLYMTCEVNEYWIVDPKAEIIDVYLFKDKIIDRPFTYKNGTDSHAVSEYFKGLEVNLKEVFA